MSWGSSCPECGRSVVVPDEVDSADMVKCPLCEGLFSVGELLSDVAAGGSFDAPELVPVSDDSSSPITEKDDTIESPYESVDHLGLVVEEQVDRALVDITDEGRDSDEAEDAPGADEEVDGEFGVLSHREFAEDEIDDPLVRSPEHDREFRLSELVIAATGEPLGVESAAAIARNVLSTPAAHTAMAETDYRVEGMGEFDFGGPIEGADEEVGAPSFSTKPRRKKQNSLGRELVGVVLGGMAGLVIAYYGLNYFGGKAKFNFMKIYLPGVAHTDEYCPDWWPWRGPGEVVSDAETVPEELGRGQSRRPAQRLEPATLSSVPEPAETGTSFEGGMGGMLEMTPGQLPDVGFPSADDANETEPASSSFPFAFPDDPPGTGTQEQHELPAADVVVGLPDSEAPQPEAARDEIEPSDVAPVSPDVDLPGAANLPEPDLDPAIEEIVQDGPTPTTELTVSGFATLADPPRYGKDDLRIALEAAQRALSPSAGAPEAGSLKLGVEGESQSRGLTEKAFEDLCSLGEIVAFVEDDGDQASVDQKLAVEDLVRSVGKSTSNVREIARLGNGRLSDLDRQSSGILFAGKIEDARSSQELHSALIKLASVEQRVALASPSPLDLQPGDRVLVLGSLLAHSGNENSPTDYSGDSAWPVIWCGVFVKF